MNYLVNEPGQILRFFVQFFSDSARFNPIESGSEIEFVNLCKAQLVIVTANIKDRCVNTTLWNESMMMIIHLVSKEIYHHVVKCFCEHFAG